jgi:hypothetical protein
VPLATKRGRRRSRRRRSRRRRRRRRRKKSIRTAFLWYAIELVSDSHCWCRYSVT